MIITVQGTNDKKNSATRFAAAFADMLSATNNNARTILIQFTDKDIDNAEDMLHRTDASLLVDSEDKERTLPILAESIDGFLTSSVNQKINNDLTGSYIKTISAIRSQQTGRIIKTIFDVIPVSRNDNFVQTNQDKKEMILEVLEGLNGERMYDYVIVVVDSKSEKLLETINGVADKTIICLNQRFSKISKVYGKDIYYVVPNFDSSSLYDMKTVIANHGLTKNDKVFKVETNTHMMDAAASGKLHNFVMKNRDCGVYDSNYYWSQDLKKIVEAVKGSKNGIDSDVLLEIDHYIIEEYATLGEGEEWTDTVDFDSAEEVEKEPKKKGLFGRKK